MKQFLTIAFILLSIWECVAQKKSQQPLEQPGTQETSGIQPPPVMQTNPRPAALAGTPDTIKIPTGATPCPCNRMDLIFTDNEKAATPFAMRRKMKGKIKKLWTTEKRDTTVGYWETLSPGEVEETLFSPAGMLLYTATEKIKRNNSDITLSSKISFRYDSDNNPREADLYVLSANPIVFTFDYAPKGSLRSIYTGKDTSLDKRQGKDMTIHFKCWQLDKRYYLLRNVFIAQVKTEQSGFVFDDAGNLMEKEQLEYRASKTSKHTKEKFGYNGQGMLTQHAYLERNGDTKSVITITNDRYGNPVKELWGSGAYTAYEYKYDPQGNWIWKRQTVYEHNAFSGQPEISERINFKRAIEYYR